MTCYSKTMTCTKCGFKHTELREVRGDFDGWDDAQLRMNPPQCPFCIHQKKLAKSLPAVEGGDEFCATCHEPKDGECACQDEYRSEHDSRSDR